MNTDLQKQLYEKYPKIFSSADKSRQETCMCWGIECGDGWYAILDRLCHNIQCHCNQDDYVNADKPTVLFFKNKWNRFFDRFVDKHAYRHFVGRHGFKSSYVIDDKNPEYVRYSAQWKKLMAFRSYWEATTPLVNAGKRYEQVTFEQVKEKFGTLRVYTNYSDSYIDGMIRMAESMSATTCENCGSNDDVDQLHPGGWVALRCKKCRDAYHTKEIACP